MDLYRVHLGIDRAARDTGRRITMCVRERDPLSAAIKAEKEADLMLNEPDVEYTHVVSVCPVIYAAKAASAALAMAA